MKELALSNVSEGGGIVVVLSDADKESMERDLLSYFTKARDLMLTKVVFRSGSRLHKTDLSFVACKRARSIIVVSDPRLDPDTADAEARPYSSTRRSLCSDAATSATLRHSRLCST